MRGRRTALWGWVVTHARPLLTAYPNSHPHPLEALGSVFHSSINLYSVDYIKRVMLYISKRPLAEKRFHAPAVGGQSFWGSLASHVADVSTSCPFCTGVQAGGHGVGKGCACHLWGPGSEGGHACVVTEPPFPGKTVEVGRKGGCGRVLTAPRVLATAHLVRAGFLAKDLRRLLCFLWSQARCRELAPSLRSAAVPV